MNSPAAPRIDANGDGLARLRADAERTLISCVFNALEQVGEFLSELDKAPPFSDPSAAILDAIRDAHVSGRAVSLDVVQGRLDTTRCDAATLAEIAALKFLPANFSEFLKLLRPAARKKRKPKTHAVVDDASGLRGEILGIVTMPKESERSKRELVADAVLSALRARGKLYYHAERRDFDSAMFFDSERARLVRVRSDEFKAFLSEWTSLNRSDRYFDAAFASIETAALAGPTTTPVLPSAFWHARPGAIYLSNGDGQLVRVTAESVELLANGTDNVLFAAGRSLAPWKLTGRRDPFETCALFRDARCSAKHGPDLIRVALYSLPTDPRCKPPHCFTGPVGSGKTRLAKGFCELYGIPFVASKVEDDREGDFWPNIDGGGVLTLDNADTRCQWLPDALAAAATDGCSQRRKLYSNAETVTLRARAWIIVTSQNPSFASDAGLADRMLVVRMDRRDEDTEDSALSDEIAEHRDANLSYIANALRCALGDTAPTPRGLNARHPDFANFAVRLGRAIGREAQFIAALAAAEQDKSAFCLENDFLGAAIAAFLTDAKEFTGTARELLDKLQANDPDLGDVSAKRLGKRISALWPHLEKQFGASKVRDRKGFNVFTFDPDCRVCRVSNGVSPITPPESDSREFIGKGDSNSANSAKDATDTDPHWQPA